MRFDDGPFTDFHMPAKGRVIYHDYIVADPAIMGHMDADHEQAIVADAGQHAAAFGSRIHGDVFANGIIAADLQNGFFALVF